MEELFKSLSESVSEECYNDIMGIVEEIINEIKKEDVNRISGDLSREQLRAWVTGTKKEQEEANKRHDKFLKAKNKWVRAKDSGRIKPYKKKDEEDEQN